MNEIWKDIPTYEGIYQISNTRKVKRLKRINEKGRLLREKEMKFTSNGGYDVISLTKDGKSKIYYIDRLMYNLFES